jgi:hypothetical protein
MTGTATPMRQREDDEGLGERRVRQTSPARWERVLFLVAVTVIAAHIVDDSFASQSQAHRRQITW